MNLAPLGNTHSLSGAEQDAASQIRRARSDQKAEQAAAFGATDADQETSDRDADGRRPWEIPGRQKEEGDAANSDANSSENTQHTQSKDATGNSGNAIDLSG